jgi:hypothetical protein
MRTSENFSSTHLGTVAQKPVGRVEDLSFAP